MLDNLFLEELSFDTDRLSKNAEIALRLVYRRKRRKSREIYPPLQIELLKTFLLSAHTLKALRNCHLDEVIDSK